MRNKKTKGASWTEPENTPEQYPGEYTEEDYISEGDFYDELLPEEVYPEGEYYEESGGQYPPDEQYPPEEQYAPEDGEYYPGEGEEYPPAEPGNGGKRRGKRQKKEKPPRVKKEKAPKEKKARKEKKPRAEKPDKKAAKSSGAVKKLKIGLIIGFCIVALIFAGIAAGGYYVSKTDTVFPKVYVDGIFVGGMKPEDIPAVLEENGWDERTAQAFRVRLPAGVSFKLDRCSAGAIFTKEAAAQAAFSHGHSGNIFSNLFDFLLNQVVAVDVSEEYLHLNEEYIMQCAADGIEKFNEKTADRGYIIDNKTQVLRMIKGAGQMKIDDVKLCNEIAAALLSDSSELDFTEITSTLTPPDFEKIHTDLSVEPQDAYYNEDFTVEDEVVGCDFDVAEASEIWLAAGPAETVEIPLAINMPEKTGEYLRSLIFRDKLGEMSSSFAGSIDARVNNIDLAASKIDGLVLMPGEVFSYNETVGQRTEEAGFLPAAAYADGEVVEEVGGGICQVSSTLYSAQMWANLETVNRVNHYFKVGYMDWGMDATVSWPKPDYKFKNNRDFPVQIRAICDPVNEQLTVEIWGTNLDGSYVKEITHSRLCVYDENYPGQVVIGFGVSAFRQVYDKDGNFLYEVTEPYGIYYKHKEDIDYPDPPADGGAGGNSADIVVQ